MLNPDIEMCEGGYKESVKYQHYQYKVMEMCLKKFTIKSHKTNYNGQIPTHLDFYQNIDQFHLGYDLKDSCTLENHF